jgi:antitoxin (DNA-binding transcriptional repressor) of toxin-antitoxin stability system
MEEVSISEFKAKCLAILITRFGKPVAEVVPPSPDKERGNWLGCMKGRMEILGDIMSPATDPEEWEVLRD